MQYDKMVMPYPYPFRNHFSHGPNFGFIPWCAWMFNTTSSWSPKWQGTMMGDEVPHIYYNI